MDKKDETADSKPISRWLTIGLPLGIFILWALTPVIAYLFDLLLSSEKLPGDLAPKSPGILGDTFGMTNTLFSGLALFALFIAIIYQARELKAQKDMLGLQLKELKLTREELKLTREQLEAQRRALEQSNLDDMFFQMLRLRNDIIRDLAQEISQKTSRTSATFFTLQLDTFRNSCKNFLSGGGDPKDMNAMFSRYWEGPKRYLDHYYRNLETILALIDDCDDYVPCLRYMRILAGQLSLDEKKLLFYHAAAYDRTQGKVFCENVARAGLVDGLECDWLIDKSHQNELKRMQGESVLNPDNQRARQQFISQKIDAKWQLKMRRENPQ